VKIGDTFGFVTLVKKDGPCVIVIQFLLYRYAPATKTLPKTLERSFVNSHESHKLYQKQDSETFHI
jgi:hypothetical protein